MAALLVDKGADIEKGFGALHTAAWYNRRAVAERLIAKGADLEKKMGEYTPLEGIARSNGRFEVFDLLVQKGAAINRRDSLGNTPLDNAVIYNNPDNRTIDLLLDRSAEVNTAPESLKAILTAAARRGHIRLFDYYRARGGEAGYLWVPNRTAAADLPRSRLHSPSSVKKTAISQSHIAPLDVQCDMRFILPRHTSSAWQGAAASGEDVSWTTRRRRPTSGRAPSLS